MTSKCNVIPATALFLLLITAATVFAAPPVPRGDDADPFEEILAHRQMEAENKTRLLKAADMSLLKRTPNQDLYDALYYDLDLQIDPVLHDLTGTVTIVAEVLTPTLTVMDLHLNGGMSVTAVNAGGNPVSHSRIGDILTVTLDRAYVFGETVTVDVSYGGDPSGDYFGWSSYGGSDMIWTLSEPYGARDWWPCKDLNTDKADSLDIRVTVPDNLVVASNGLLVSDVDNGATRTFHWHTNYPTVTYLVSLAIHPYHQFSTWYTPLAGGADMEIQHFVYQDQVSTAPAAYDVTDEMMTVFAQAYGEYPFVDEKYGHASFVWGGGMEHQTITSMGGLWHDVISHELAHQWWGDMVTCADFHHIWLNEGFATWSEAYWKEISDSKATYNAYMSAAAYYGSGTIYVADATNVGAIFSSNLSYNKGSWIVHMLRGVLGDLDFFRGLAGFRQFYEYGSATTEQLRDVMELTSGQDLDAFFQQWIYGEYFPVYAPSYATIPGVGGATDVELTLAQTQINAGVFTMPVGVRITTTDGDFDFTVQNDQQLQSWTLPVTGDVVNLVIDPEDLILCQIETVVTNPSLDQGILLVNGVDWLYGSEITTAYADSIFTGQQGFDFWDIFSEPAGGYIAQLPVPTGTGSLNADILGNYSTVVWVGNNYNGDLAVWQEAPIQSYLEAGGNVLLMGRYAYQFMDTDLTAYLGVTWTGGTGTLLDATSTYAGFVDMPLIGTQSYNNYFNTSVGVNSTLLMTSAVSGSGTYGTGVIAVPPAGGTFRSDGGRFAVLSGRPYRYDHASLRANTEFILSSQFGEPYNPLSFAPEERIPGQVVLKPNYPNPFNPRTTIAFVMPISGHADLEIYDVSGRRIKTLFSGTAQAGTVEAIWNGNDDTGRAVASGSYFARLKTGGESRVQSLMLVR
jgi:Peptidase family M1 domain/Peptidase M1 N-terminal domain/FlgD Ig-like domain